MKFANVAIAGIFSLGLSSAQLAVPGGAPTCGGLEVAGRSDSNKLSSSSALEPRAIISAPGTGSQLCFGYTYAGWKTTMRLRLGEGVAEYLDVVERAVDLWNETLMGFNQKPVIELVQSSSPRNFNLSDQFWDDSDAESETLATDGQSVIYFKPSTESQRSTRGFVRFRWDSSRRMTEADIYVNTYDEVTHGRDLAKTTLALETEEGRGVYVYVDAIYLTVLHEIGHALGLKHIPVSGNIMSYSFMPRMREIWRAPLVPIFYLYEQSGLRQNPLVRQIGDVPPYVIVSDSFTLEMLPMYTHAVDLGHQDRMALMCIYDFEDWNH